VKKMRVYDTIIVGSGYGGSVMAARLAPTRRVLLVERGRRWAPEEFPRDVIGLAQGYLRAGAHGAGLWGMRLGRGVGNAYVSALGGASLLNYGISMQPEDHAFEGWPVDARELAPFYARAREILRPSPNPRGDALGDKAFLDAMEPGTRRDIDNTVDWSRCSDCGNCPLGCRHGAKLSLDRTYLALAERQGAEIRTETTLIASARVARGWELLLRRTGSPRALPERVATRELILAAGTFGTIDLLLRHRDLLPLSPRFGRGMSMNGDSMAFLYNTRTELDGASGAPISTASVTHFMDNRGRPRTLTIMSGRIPGAAMPISARILGLLAEVLGDNRGPLDGALPRAQRRLRDLVGVGPRGALSQTFMYKLDAQDSASGVLGRDRCGRAAIDWESYQDEPILRFAARKLDDWASRVGGRVVRDPATWPGMRSFGVHALGGCAMGRSFADGVTDSVGRVFAPGGGHYPGLRIVDASILPGALGVPPSLTIAALAERAAAQMTAERSAS
jgi:cholesterol oxidase